MNYQTLVFVNPVDAPRTMTLTTATGHVDVAPGATAIDLTPIGIIGATATKVAAAVGDIWVIGYMAPDTVAATTVSVTTGDLPAWNVSTAIATPPQTTQANVGSLVAGLVLGVVTTRAVMQ